MKSATLVAALIAALVLVLSAGCTSSGSGTSQGPGMSRYGGSGGSGGGGGWRLLTRRHEESEATKSRASTGSRPLARDALPHGTTQRIAFTSAGVTFAGWPPHVARR